MLIRVPSARQNKFGRGNGAALLSHRATAGCDQERHI